MTSPSTPFVPRAALALSLVALSGCAAAAPAPADPAPASETAAFVVTLGVDTVAVERFTRTRDRIVGEVVTTSPRTVVRSYQVDLAPDGTASQVRMTTRTVAEPAAPPQTVTVHFAGEHAEVRAVRGDTVDEFRVEGAGGAVPWVPYAYGLVEYAAGIAAARGATTELRRLPVGGRNVSPATFRRAGGDTVLVDDFAGRAHATIDAEGRLLRLDSPESTLKVTVERLADFDVARFAAAHGRRDLAGAGMGVLSPRDSVRAEIGGASVSVAYGRPWRRGRTIFGTVVPWGEVWRTGANAATHLRTDRDLEIGGVRVPAGEYSLFTIPRPDAWTLIVNEQTGQWGTAHDPSRDVARVRAEPRRLAEPVEQFTIRLDPLGADAGVLVMAWDDTEVSLPVRVLP